MDMHLVGIIIVKLWWLIIPVAVGTIVGIRSDRKEDRDGLHSGNLERY